MSIYSTQNISREEAEKLVLACRAKNDRSVKALSIGELDAELHQYVYARTDGNAPQFSDVLPWGINYIIDL